MKRNILTAIPFLALGGLLLTGCFDGSSLASASDENKVQAESSDKTELVTSAAVGDRWYRVSLKPTGRTYSYVKMSYFYNGDWKYSGCIDIRKKNVWTNTNFNIPSEVGLHVNAFISAKCNKQSDRFVDLGFPSGRLGTWFVTLTL